MPYNVYITTAEDIIGATDAALQQSKGVDETLVTDFLDSPPQNARNALLMAQELGLVENNNQIFTPKNPIATYLITSSLPQKASTLRLVLEQYEPYRFFKSRLQLSGSLTTAANQVKAIYGLAAHRQDIIGTLVSLGTYTNSLRSEGAGRYEVSGGEVEEFLVIVNEVVQQRETTEVYIRKRIGAEVADWIDRQDVLEHLITAYQRLSDVDNDSRAPIVHAANAVESFLVQVANHYGVNIINSNGINAKADRIAQAGNLTDKHKFVIKYIGHVRNAADHGIDQAIGRTWDINISTAIETVNVSLTMISSIVNRILHNKYIV
jgi:hypothetical protein